MKHTLLFSFQGELCSNLSAVLNKYIQCSDLTDNHIDYLQNLLPKMWFSISDVPTAPLEGEVVDFVWEDFINFKDVLALLKYFTDGEVQLCARILTRYYRKDLLITRIALIEIDDYKQMKIEDRFPIYISSN